MNVIVAEIATVVGSGYPCILLNFHLQINEWMNGGGEHGVVAKLM